jgi:hypothetical protein
MILHDKVVQIQIADNTIYALTQSGAIYKKALTTGAQWVKVKVPKWQPTK